MSAVINGKQEAYRLVDRKEVSLVVPEACLMQVVLPLAAIPHKIVDFEGEAPCFVLTLPLSGFQRAGIDRNAANQILQGELLIDNVKDVANQIAFQRLRRRQSGRLGTSQPVWKVTSRRKFCRLPNVGTQTIDWARLLQTWQRRLDLVLSKLEKLREFRC